MSYYWIFGVIVFLFVLSAHKYKDIDVLKENLQDYINKLYNKTCCLYTNVDIVNNKENVTEPNIEINNKSMELQKLIVDFVVSNPDIFSAVEVKDE